MPQLYKSVEGWFTFPYFYNEVIEKHHTKKDSGRPSRFAEVGCWFGQSSVYMLERLKELESNTLVTFVDTWIGGIGEPEFDLVNKNGFNYVYDKFIDNIARVEYPYYDISREFSHITTEYDTETFDFIFIDAGHRGSQPYKDLSEWYPLLKKGGTIGGHDIDYPDVLNAVNRFCKENDLIYRVSPSPQHCWIIDK